MKKILLLLIPITLLISGCGVGAGDLVGPETSGIWEGIIKFFSLMMIEIGAVLGNNIINGLIVAATIFKLLSFPLSKKQIRNSAEMAKHAPEINKIKAKYAGKKDNDSKMKMHNETQAIYKKHGINPFAGCLPTLVQMPLLFAFYGAISNLMVYTVNSDGTGGTALVLYGAEDMTMNFLWWSDLGEPVIIFAIIAAATTYVSTVLSTYGSESQDGAQMMKTMKIAMPLMILFFGFTLPGALSLYWIIGNIFTILQTLILKKDIIKATRDKNKLKSIKK
ncbi:MAG: YidC/Oxa1 family membrane protein insertase [Spiroplasma sp.]|nr:YidC/Oxa1 family membrane protein insertase [Mycoplasmatales bacterium]